MWHDGYDGDACYGDDDSYDGHSYGDDDGDDDDDDNGDAGYDGYVGNDGDAGVVDVGCDTGNIG